MHLDEETFVVFLCNPFDVRTRCLFCSAGKVAIHLSIHPSGCLLPGLLERGDLKQPPPLQPMYTPFFSILFFSQRFAACNISGSLAKCVEISTCSLARPDLLRPGSLTVQLSILLNSISIQVNSVNLSK